MNRWKRGGMNLNTSSFNWFFFFITLNYLFQHIRFSILLLYKGFYHAHSYSLRNHLSLSLTLIKYCNSKKTLHWTIDHELGIWLLMNIKMYLTLHHATLYSGFDRWRTPLPLPISNLSCPCNTQSPTFKQLVNFVLPSRVLPVLIF